MVRHQALLVEALKELAYDSEHCCNEAINEVAQANPNTMGDRAMRPGFYVLLWVRPDCDYENTHMIEVHPQGVYHEGDTI